MQTNAPVGLRFLILGGDALVSLDLADMLADLGHIVVATVNQLDKAMSLAAEATLDVAIMDMSVRGQPTFALARMLRNRKVQVIFASGNGRKGLDPRFRNAPVLSMPFCTEGLSGMISKTCGSIDGQAA